jgi:hypothetical protein
MMSHRMRKFVLVGLLLAAQVLLACWIVDFLFRRYEQDHLLSYVSMQAGTYDPASLLFNDHGERITRKKAPGEFRILAFGDSYTYAITDPNLSFCAVLERELSKRLGRTVRVVNLGYPGVSFPEYINNIFFWTQALEYDAILSNIFIGNDFEDVRHIPYDPKAIEAGLRSLCTRGLPYGPNTLVPYLYAFRFLDYLKADILNEMLRSPVLSRVFHISDPTGEFPNPPGYRTMLQLSQERIDVKHRVNLQPYNSTLLYKQDNALPWYRLHLAILSRFAAKGVPVLVTLSPPPCVISPDIAARTRQAMHLAPGDIDLSLPRRLTLELAKQVGLPVCDVLDLTPCLSERTPTGEPTYVPDTHWSIAGNAWVGNLLAGELARRWFGQSLPVACPQPTPAFETIPAGQFGPGDNPERLVNQVVGGCQALPPGK